jgi:AraC family transcriptional regulator, transcriptional activator of pobA
MAPYRFDFYQVVLFEQSADARLSINTHTFENLSDQLMFASPEHVLAWRRGAAQRGFILYFTAAFLAPYPRSVLEEFPYFRLNELNAVPLSSADKAILGDHFTRLLHLFESRHPYRVQMLRSLLLVLLFEARRLHDQQERVLQDRSAQQLLVFRFEQFVNQHYLIRKQVRAYADLLAISPDYLRQVVKAVTGKTPLQLIADRILLEAKTLLAYSDLSIGEVSAYLGYAEPSQFGRFFRKQTGSSPAAWRNCHS